MSTSPRYAFQSPSVSSEKGSYRMRPPRSSRPGSTSLRFASDPSSRAYLNVPYRRTRRLLALVAVLACAALACFAGAYWLFTTSTVDAFQRTTPNAPHIPADALDEPDARLDALRTDTTATYLAYLPHSGLHNQRIALENALTLAHLLNRTLLVPPARLGPKTLRYVRSDTLARMLRLSDKRQGRAHCAYIPTNVPMPGECIDYAAYTLVPWAWLVDLAPIEARQTIVRVSNGSAVWVAERLGVRPEETRYLPDTAPYEYRFVDTPAPMREGNKYHRAVLVDTLVNVPERLIQLGTLFGSSRLRLRKAANRRVRTEVRQHMITANAALTRAAERIGEALGGAYVAAHVRVGDGQFQALARAHVRDVWWGLVRNVLGVDVEMVLALERRVLAGGEPEMGPDMGSRNALLLPLAPLGDAFSPKRLCRDRLHTSPSLRRLNVPVYIATDAPGGLDDPLLAPLTKTFPCIFTLAAFESETGHLEGLWNGYDGMRLGGYVAPIVDGLVMGRARGVVGTEGSTFSRYVVDVLWQVSHGMSIVERG